MTVVPFRGGVMARMLTITADEPQLVASGRTRLRAVVEIDLTVAHEIDALERVPAVLAGLEGRLLALWLVDDLADVIEFHREVYL